MGSPFYPCLFSPSEEEEDDIVGRWEEIKRRLQANPDVISMELLLSVLKQRPPTYVVEYLLTHSSVQSDHLLPRRGPTPLQVAVVEGCNAAIVKLLTQACPWALCVTSEAAPEDPLSIAKRLGKPDLVAVLQRPMTHWLEKDIAIVPKRCKEGEEDLNNVKLLCARLIKRNQQLSKDVKHLKTTIQAMIQSDRCNVKLAEEEATTNCRINEWEIRLEEEAAWNEAVRNDLVGWKQEVQKQWLTLQESLREKRNDENNPLQSNHHDYLPNHFDPPKRRCRPFHSIS